MGAFLRAAFRRYWPAALLSAGITVATGLLVASRQPDVWRVEADVFVTEPWLLNRLVNPFTALPEADAGLKGVDLQLVSTERLISLVKGTGLIDQWSTLRSAPQRARQRLVELFRGPMTEKDQLDTLVELLRGKISVALRNRHVHITVDWPERTTAFRLASGELDALTHGMLVTELAAATESMAVLDERLALIRQEGAARVDRIAAELARAAQEQRLPQITTDEEGLRELRSREQEVVVRTGEKHLELDVVRRANGLRYLVITPPELPRRPVSPGPGLTLLVWVLVAALSALVGPVVLALAAQGLAAGRSGEAAGDKPPPYGERRFVHRAPSPLATLPGVLVPVLLAGVTGAALGTAQGDLFFAVEPLLVAGALWLLWALPLKWPLLALAFSSMAFDDPTDRAYVGQWHSPLYLPGKYLFTNIAYFTGFELCLFGLLALMLLRRLMDLRVDPVQDTAPRPLRHAVFLSLATVLWLLAMGLARGGEFRQALWQFRFLLMLPIFATMGMHAFEFPKDLRKVAVALLVGSLVKAAFGIYFMVEIAHTLRAFPPHTSGHNDTILFVTAAMVPLALLWEKPTRGALLLALLWLPAMALALRYNDRRIAYVDLCACAAAIFMLSPRHPMKRFVSRATVVLLPVVALYLAAGWNQSSGRLFIPVQKVRSLIDPEEGSKAESSNVERDIENYNLNRSWQANPLLGQGFGHAFTEFLPSNDFSQSNFGHVGHNSVLWLIWIGGIFGFTGLFLYVGVAAFFLARTLRRTRNVEERAALLVALAVLITALNQCFGDMGTQSIEIAFFVGLALAVIGRLATRHGAWLESPAVELRSAAEGLRA